jgi:hypothetical protein
MNCNGQHKEERTMINKPDFNEALDSLCEQMNLIRGTISEEGQMSTCPVYFSLSSPNGFYATQVVGTVMGTPEEIICHLMMVHTTPLLKTSTDAYIGHWCLIMQKWEFSN